MQSNLVKLFKFQDGRISSFFFRDGSLYTAQCSQTTAPTVYTISSDVLPVFSLASDNGSPVVIFRKSSGGIYISKFTYGKWNEKALIKPSAYENIKISLFIASLGPVLLYCSPPSGKNPGSLFLAAFYDKLWHSPVFIDNITSFGGSYYLPLSISNNHLILLYSDGNYPLVSKELLMNPVKTGKTMPILTGSAYVCDLSAVVKEDILHIAAVIRLGRIFRLIYVNRSESGISPVITLWESPKIDSCCIFIPKDKIHVFCISGRNIFCSCSNNNGASFDPIHRYKASPNRKIIKAEFINTCRTLQNSYSEVYVYADSLLETAFMEDIDPSFYSENTAIKAAETDIKSNLEETLNIYKNKAEYYEKCFNEANKKLGELSKKLAQRNEELSTLNSKWVKRYNSLKAQCNPKPSGTALVPVKPQNPPPGECPP